MEKKNIEIKLSMYKPGEELGEEVQKTIDAAIAAAANSYAPYSGFNVGAAVLLENGEIVSGSNQENAAYPSGLCAERVALFWAGAHYSHLAIKIMAVVALKDGKIVADAAAPCGSCRQVINESVARQKMSFPLYMVGANRVVKVDDANDLLPLSFGPSSL